MAAPRWDARDRPRRHELPAAHPKLAQERRHRRELSDGRQEGRVNNGPALVRGNPRALNLRHDAQQFDRTLSPRRLPDPDVSPSRGRRFCAPTRRRWPGPKPNPTRPAPRTRSTDAKKDAKKGAGKPEQLGSYGDWGVYLAAGQGQDLLRARLPQGAPAQGESEGHASLHIHLYPPRRGRAQRGGDQSRLRRRRTAAPPVANVDDDKFELVTKGVNAWVKNPAKEREFVEALKGGAKLLRQGLLRQGLGDRRQLFAQGPLRRAGPRRAGV